MECLSDISLLRIMSFLKQDPSTSDYFRRTCSRINEHACSKGIVRVEYAIINMSCLFNYHIDENEIAEGFYFVQSFICVETSCPSCKFCQMRANSAATMTPQMNAALKMNPGMPGMMMYLLPTRETPWPLEEVNVEGVGLSDESVLRIDFGSFNPLQYRFHLLYRMCNGSGRIFPTFAPKTDKRSSAPTDDIFIERCEELLRKVRSVGVLNVSCWKVGGNIIRYLTNHPKLRNLREVKFRNCLMLMKKEEFLTFLKSKSIKQINLESRFKEFFVDDTCLMDIDNIHITAHSEISIFPHYTEITDNLLINWIRNPPTKVFIRDIVTNFTIKGIQLFIEACLFSNSSTEFNLGIIGATNAEFEKFIKNNFAVRGLVWKIDRLIGKWTPTITIKHNDKFKLTFEIRIRKDNPK